MNRFRILYLFPLALLLHVPLWGQGVAEVAFVPETTDFGTVEMGTVVEVDFEYENTGSGVLILSKAKPGCSCTKLEFTADTLAPGESGSFRLLFDTANRIGSEQLSVSVWTNADPPIHRLHVTGTIEWPKTKVDEQ